MKTGFFLMAAGLGTRARPLSAIRPKSLFPLAGAPLLDHLVQSFGAAEPASPGWINIHHLPQAFPPALAPHPHLTPLHEEQLSGTAILSRFACPRELDALWLRNGDVWLTSPPWTAMREALGVDGARAVLGVRPLPPHGRYRGLAATNGLLKGRCDGAPPPGQAPFLFTGLELLERSILPRLHGTNFVDDLLEQGIPTRMVPVPGDWWDLGSPPTYLQAVLALRQSRALTPLRVEGTPPGIAVSPLWEEVVFWPGASAAPQTPLQRVILTDGVVLPPQHPPLRNTILTPEGAFPLS